MQDNNNTEERYIVTYNGKEVGKTAKYYEANAIAWAYGNGSFENIEIIDTNSGEILTKLCPKGFRDQHEPMCGDE